jgi:hypothetical protein
MQLFFQIIIRAPTKTPSGDFSTIVSEKEKMIDVLTFLIIFDCVTWSDHMLIRRAEDDPDINKEYQRQRTFLEKNIDSLNRKLQKDASVHKKDHLRIIQVWLKAAHAQRDGIISLLSFLFPRVSCLDTFPFLLSISLFVSSSLISFLFV